MSLQSLSLQGLNLCRLNFAKFSSSVRKSFGCVGNVSVFQVLINNAGLVDLSGSKTSDGLEIVTQVVPPDLICLLPTFFSSDQPPLPLPVDQPFERKTHKSRQRSGHQRLLHACHQVIDQPINQTKNQTINQSTSSPCLPGARSAWTTSTMRRTARRQP